MIGLILAVVVLIASFVAKGAINGKDYPMAKKITPIVGIVLCVILLVISCISYVPTGYTGIVTTFGKVHDNTLDAGLNFHAPWDNVINMDNREQRVPFKLEAFSKDIQQVDVQGSINYNIDKSTAMNLYKDVGTNYSEVLIQPRILEDVKIVIAKYTAENLIANRQNAADEIFELIRAELEPKGIHVISFAIENIDFTDAFESAVEAKQVATQEKQKAQTQQEQKTMETEQAAKRQKIEAEAAAEVQKIDADAEAYAIKVKAEAEADANKKLNESITSELINYNEILRWDGKLPTFMGGDGVMPILNFGGVE